MAFVSGDVVKLTGLTTASHLNGLIGVVLKGKIKSNDVPDNRVGVQILLRQKRVHVTTKNLLHVDLSNWDLPDHQAEDKIKKQSKHSKKTGEHQQKRESNENIDSFTHKLRNESSENTVGNTHLSQTHSTIDSSSLDSLNGASTVSPSIATDITTKTSLKKSMFDDAFVILALGGQEVINNLRLQLEKPFLEAPQNPSTNLKFAELILSAAIATRANGVFFENFIEFEMALSCLKFALSNAKVLLPTPRQRSEVWTKLGVLQHAGCKSEEALESLRTACKTDPTDDSAANLLAYYLEVSGHMKEAEEQSYRCLEMQPHHAESISRLCSLIKISSSDDSLYTMVVAAVRDCESRIGTISSKDRALLRFSLAKLLVQLGKVDEAAKNLHQANAICKTIPGAHWDDPNFGYATNGMSGDPTPIFIIGMPRSGSSLVEQILSSHAAVFGGGENTPFNPLTTNLMRSLGSIQPYSASPLLKATGQEYIKRMAMRAGSCKFFTDKHLMNFWHVGLIQLMLPKAKIIHISRGAMDTCFSCYRHFFEAGTITFANSLEDLGSFYNLYHQTMQAYEKVLKPGLVLNIAYEDIVNDFDNTCSRIFKHCGLELVEEVKTFWKTSRVVDTNSSAQVRRPLYKQGIGQWQKFQQVEEKNKAGEATGRKFLDPLRKFLQPTKKIVS